MDWPELVLYASRIRASQAADVLESSYLASSAIFATGRVFLSVGSYVIATASVAPLSHNPDMIWVIAHCAKEAVPNGTL